MRNDSVREGHDIEIDLVEYGRVLYVHRRFIGAVTAAVFVVSVVVSLLMPKSYTATTSILPPQKSDMMENPLSKLSGGMGGLVGSLMGEDSQATLWMEILSSRRVQSSVMERHELRERFGCGGTDQCARKKLNHLVTIEKTKGDMVHISVEDSDPEVAAYIANALVEELDKVNREIITTSGRRLRVFAEKRLEEAGAELARAEDRLREFQTASGAIMLDDQTRAIIETMGSVKGELIAKEVELETMLSYATPGNPRAQLLRAQAEELRQKMKALERGGDAGMRDGFFIPTSDMPNLALQYARLLRDTKVSQAVYELLTQQYEMARLREARDTATVQVLDEAMPPEKPSKPRKKLIVSLSTFFVLILSSIGVLVRNNFSSSTTDL